jgi:TRAP-type transport system periplasmic protein
MMRRSLALMTLLAAIGAGASPAAQTITLRMAANVPANSPWDLGLKRLAAEFERVSEGKVKVTFPQSVRVASETDIIQKMKLGIDGALLTTSGLAQLYPDSLAMSMPSFVRNDAEFEAVLAAVRPLLEAKVSDRYVVLAVSLGGWVRYFSRGPVVYPADLAKIRVSISPEDDKVMRLMQSVGTRTVKGDTAAFLLQLNSNGVDAACVSPIYIASLWSQLRGKINYMTPFKVAPFIGAVFFTKSSWEKIPADVKPKLEAVIKDMAQKISLDSEKLENDAIASMLKDGLKTTQMPADAEAKWGEMITERRNGLIAEMFSPDILQAMDAALAKVRAKK